MAVRTLLRNLGLLNGDALRPLPTHLLARLWSTIKYYLLDSVHLWRLFASIGGLELGSKRWNQKQIDCRRHGLKDSIKWATSTSIQWMTNLTVSELDCSVDEMMYIQQMPNLRNLVIQAGEYLKSHLSDSILREWAHSSKRYGTLSHLQTMFIARQNITSWCLQYLNHFPSLDTFCAYRCNYGARDTVSKIADQEGWSLDKRGGTFHATVKRLSKHCQPGYKLIHLGSSYTEHRQLTKKSSINSLPHLQLNFGNAGKKPKPSMLHFSIADPKFFCFERNWEHRLSAAGVTTVDMEQGPAVHQEKPAKRRRREVKASKSISLPQHIFFDD